MSPNTRFVGKEEMEELMELALKKGYYVGATLLPLRNAEQLKEDKDPADLIIFLSGDKPVIDHVVASDVATQSLDISCKFLIAELKNLPSA